MNLHSYLCNLEANGSPAGAIAFFDLDRTLIAGYSLTALAWERMRSGTVSFSQVAAQLGVLMGYGLGRADYHDLLFNMVNELSGVREQDLVDLGERAFEQRVRRWIYREARVLIDTHRRRSHPIVMITSATRYQAAPIARELGVDQLCCTELEIRDGRFTGTAVPCYGLGKLTAAESVVRDRQGDLAHAFFYSDSLDDLPLLEAVGRPVVANPRAAMQRIAGSRGWPCLRFRRPSGA